MHKSAPKNSQITRKMITTKIYLDKRACTYGTPAPLKLCITHQGRSAYISLDLRILPSNWDSKKQKVIDHPNKRNLNSYIDNRKTAIDNIIRELAVQGKLKNLTVTQIKNMVVSVFDPYVDSSRLFYARYLLYIEKCKATRTKEIYQATLNHILKFDPKVKTYAFEDISRLWLEDFDDYLSKTSPSKNARNIHFRNIRAVFNAAIDDDITTAYPFRKFKIHSEETRKRNLTREQMQMLLTYDCKKYQRKYLDCFLLMFYLSGINGVDLLNAKPEQVVNGRLEYKRSKTGKLMSVRLEPEALALIEKYKGRDRLVRWGERRKTYKSFMMNLNKTMNDIIPGCTSYWARHTIASLAAELDIPNETIAQILGHSDESHRTTLIYINFEQSKADKACRKIFDCISGSPHDAY